MKTREQLIQELRDMSDNMIKLGADLNYFAGFDRELAQKGLEMIGAGQLAEQWADAMEKKI